jgi:hypothetical protein
METKFKSIKVGDAYLSKFVLIGIFSNTFYLTKVKIILFRLSKYKR